MFNGCHNIKFYLEIAPEMDELFKSHQIIYVTVAEKPAEKIEISIDEIISIEPDPADKDHTLITCSDDRTIIAQENIEVIIQMLESVD